MIAASPPAGSLSMLKTLPESDSLASALSLARHEAGRRRGVGVREVDLLLAFVGDRHAVHDDVELARLEAGDHAVPVLGDDLALDVSTLAEVVGEVDLEADDLAARVGQVPRIVGPLHADHDGLPVLGESRRRDGQRGDERCANDDGFHEFRAHVSSPDACFLPAAPRTRLAASRGNLNESYRRLGRLGMRSTLKFWPRPPPPINRGCPERRRNLGAG